jgi:hypothetical protein
MRAQLLIVGLLSVGTSLLNACGGDSAPARMDASVTPPPESEDADAAADADEPEPDCVEKPETHLEIINACTDAEKVEKELELPLLLEDGGLRPLP